jgi:hypothetical protein
MVDRRVTAAATLVLVLAGAGIAQGWDLIVTELLTSARLPDTSVFQIVFWAGWFPLACLTASAGILGAYQSLCRGDVSSRWLTVFAILYTFTITVSGYELGWSFFRLALGIKFYGIGIGINLLGLILQALLKAERIRSMKSGDREMAEAAPAGPINDAERSGAV